MSGEVSIQVHAIRDVDHLNDRLQTFVGIKSDKTDEKKDRPETTQSALDGDVFRDEVLHLVVEKANEIELIVYDRTSKQTLPVALLWFRLSDIAEDIRRKKIEAELAATGWVSADKMGGGSGIQPDLQFQPPPGQNYQGAGGPMSGSGPRPGPGLGPQPHNGPVYITDWFSLEPAGRIRLTIGLVKHTGNKQPFDLGLGRKGAIRQKKEEVHEQYGHKFVQQQFYNIMRCALCGGFLKGGTGMQCTDCRFTCHVKCYTKVVTKCITQSNAETDPDEAKLNHRIPHRFIDYTNAKASWCCHCGYVLPLGRKKVKICSGQRFIFLISFKSTNVL